MLSRQQWAAAQPWVTLTVRLAAGVIMVWAGAAKLGDLPQSVRAVRAYELLPEAVVPAVGNGLPFAEILMGAFFIAGAFTRLTAIAYLLMMAAFTFGVLWAWSQGLTIDCGCFGGGGQVEAHETNYGGHLLERGAFIALGAWLLWRPQSPFSLDVWLARSHERVAKARATLDAESA